MIENHEYNKAIEDVCNYLEAEIQDGREKIRSAGFLKRAYNSDAYKAMEVMLKYMVEVRLKVHRMRK